MKFKAPYTAHVRKPTINKEPSMTKPEDAEELEINNIMARYVATGYLPKSEIPARFEDLSVPMDFAAAQDKVLEARRAFIELPLDVRDEFRTAETFLNAFQTDKGRKKLEGLGILTKRQEEPPKAPTEPAAGVPPVVPPKGTAS